MKLPGGSNTVQDALQVGKGGNARSILAKSLIGIGAGGGAMVGGGFTAALGAVGAKAIGDMRMAGIEKVDDILADALLNPGRARLLLTAPTTKRSEEQTWQMLGALYRRSAAVSGASSLDGNGLGTERREPVRIDATRAAGVGR